MSDPAIRAQNLSKRYRLGQRASYHRFSDLITHAALLPWRALRRVIGSGAGVAASGGGHDMLWALKDVSFDIHKGEVVGIIGRNGAGKSTLLKILSRITEPTSGRAEIHGRVGSLLEVGTGFHPELTGRENIYLNGAILGMHRGETQRKFDEIVAFAEVERFLDTPVKHYSSGMYMRLAFAVAAHLEPEILLVDEVLAVGDAQFQKKCLGKMGEVSKTGRTVLFVSHNMNAVEDLCEKVMLLQNGQVQQYSDDVRGVIKQYLLGGNEHSSQAAVWHRTDDRLANPYFSPIRGGLYDGQGQPVAMPMRNDTETFIVLEGEVAEPAGDLTVGYAIYAESGDLLYWSYQTDTSEDQWPKLEPGRRVIRSRLPMHLFNEGAYRVEILGSLHCRQWLFEPGVNAPSFTITIQGGLSESPYWMLRRLGLLAPVLPWERVS